MYITQFIIGYNTRMIARNEQPKQWDDLLRAAGIDSINVDLIAGLPGQTQASWNASLDWIEKLGVPLHEQIDGEAYRGAGASNQVINVVSAYRSPETNAMLRSRSRAVAKYSQHMLGKAMDTTMPGMPMSHIREVGMRMQRGGVGYYPTANTPFVHLDVGNVRHWPRMSHDQLARLFPDGKTVHIGTDGKQFPRYDEAYAEVIAAGGSVVGTRCITISSFRLPTGAENLSGREETSGLPKQKVSMSPWRLKIPLLFTFSAPARSMVAGVLVASITQAIC